jgi:hypothetical protein
MNDKLKGKIKSTVFKLGLKSSIEVFGRTLIKQAFSDNPLLFLSQYNNLTKIDSDQYIHLKDKEGETIVMYHSKRILKKGGNVYINANKIWMFFSWVMGFDKVVIDEIIKDWLKNEYGIVGLEPTAISV